MLRRLAPLLALAPLAFGPAALAATSGLQQGSFSVPYSCSVSPTTVTLTPSGSTATGSIEGAFSRNSDTVVSLSPLTISGPAGPIYGGSISISNAEGGPVVVANGSTANPAYSSTQGGIASGFYSTAFSLNTNESAFRAGNFTISATLSCAQA